MKKIFENKPRFIFWLGFVVVLIITILGVIFGPKVINRDILATVGDEKITTIDLNEAIYGINFSGTPENPGTKLSEEERKNMIEELITRSLVRQEMARLGMEISEEEILAFIKENVPNYEEYTSQQKLLTRAGAKDMISIEKLKDSQIAWREGRVLIVRFDRAYQEFPENKEEVYKKDREHARALIERLHAKIKTEEITFEQAMETANNDPVVGKPAWGQITYTFSFEFTQEDSISRGILSRSRDFWNNIFQIKEEGVSDIKMARTEAFDKNLPPEIDSLYFVVETTDVQEGYNSYEDLIKALSERFVAVRYF